jgi:hypothetical protein
MGAIAQVRLDIFARLTDLDPLNAQWRSDREIARQRLGSLDQSGEGQA